MLRANSIRLIEMLMRRTLPRMPLTCLALLASCGGDNTTIQAYGEPDCTNVSDSVVEFADPVLELSVRMQILKSQGPLTRRDLCHVTELYTLSAITDLDGLGYLTNLTKLTLPNSQVIDLSPLADLSNLMWLELDGVQSTDLTPLSNLRSLRVLHLWTTLTNIEFISELTNIYELSLLWGRISDISPLRNLTGMQSLYIRGNPIEDLSPLKNMKDLLDLKCEKCDIVDVTPLASLTTLRYLDLQYNQITDLSPIRNLMELRTINLWGNQDLASLESLSNLTNLVSLDLGSTSISDISPLVFNPGIGSGDTVQIRGNPLSSESVEVYIPVLIGRGANVFY